ncbi:MAG: hypothetical protein ACKVTZ_04965 [Bacteroidia bacterium]
MNLFKKNHYFTAFAFCLLLGSSCTLTELDKVKLDDFAPELALPLINANFTVQDILDNFDTGGFIGQDNAGIIRLVYKGNVLELKGDELFTVPNIAPVNVPLVSTGSTTTVALPSLNGEKLSEIRFKAGTMKLTFKNPSAVLAVTVSLSFPDCQKNGQPLSITKTLSPNQSETETIAMAGYRALLPDGKFNLSYNVNSTQPISQVDLTFELNQVKYSYLEGNFQQIGFNFPLDSVDLPIFRNLTDGAITFTDPRVAFNFNNSYGLPLRISTQTLSAFTQLGGVIPFSSPAYFNAVTGKHEFDFAYPSIGEVGQSKSTTIALNRSNSNLGNIISNIPHEVLYELSAESNPNNLPDNFFITDSSKLAIDVNVELPFTGKAKWVTLLDTFKVSFDAFAALQTAGFKAVIENSLPFAGDLQLYFYHSNGTLLDSMFTGSATLFTAAENLNAQTLSPTKTNKEAYFDAARFKQLKTSTQIVLKARMSTLREGQDEVNIYNTSGLSVKLGVISSVGVAGLVK